MARTSIAYLGRSFAPYGDGSCDNRGGKRHQVDDGDVGEETLLLVGGALTTRSTNDGRLSRADQAAMARIIIKEQQHRQHTTAGRGHQLQNTTATTSNNQQQQQTEERRGSEENGEGSRSKEGNRGGRRKDVAVVTYCERGDGN